MILSWLILMIAFGLFAYGGGEAIVVSYDSMDRDQPQIRRAIEHLGKAVLFWLAAAYVAVYLFELLQTTIGGL